MKKSGKYDALKIVCFWFIGEYYYENIKKDKGF